MDGLRRSRFRHVAAWLAIWALAIHGILPLGQGLAAPSDTPWAAPYLVICTAAGLHRIPNPDRPAEADDRYSCPICQVHAVGGAMAPAEAASVHAPAEARGRCGFPPEDARAPSATVSVVRARGPPLG